MLGTGGTDICRGFVEFDNSQPGHSSMIPQLRPRALEPQVEIRTRLFTSREGTEAGRVLRALSSVRSSSCNQNSDHVICSICIMNTIGCFGDDGACIRSQPLEVHHPIREPVPS